MRIGSNTTTGLRFINVNNLELIETLKQNFTNVSFGTVVIAKTNLSSNFLTVNTAKSTDSVANKIYHTSQGLGRWYQKYTACVTNIPVANLKTDVVARPYIKYTDRSGVVRYIYGEQYATNIYAAAQAAYQNPNESAQVKNYLFHEILNKFGVDNDTDIEF